jgi:hypothetical protein
MTFKLTPTQKELAFQLYRTGNALGANLNTVKALLSENSWWTGQRDRLF